MFLHLPFKIFKFVVLFVAINMVYSKIFIISFFGKYRVKSIHNDFMNSCTSIHSLFAKSNITVSILFVYRVSHDVRCFSLTYLYAADSS